MSQDGVVKSERLSSVDNAFRLLKLLSSREYVRVGEAATELGIAPSSAHRLLRTMCDNGFVLQNRSNGAYRLGSVFEELGAVAFRKKNVRRLAHPILEDLVRQTGETVTVSLLEGHDLHFVDSVEGTRYAHIRHKTGLVMSPNYAAAGKAILAMLPRNEFERRFADPRHPIRTNPSVSTWSDFFGSLAEVRKKGYAVCTDEGRSGLSAVAAPFRDRASGAVAAIAIAVPSSRFPGAADGLADTLTRTLQSVGTSGPAGRGPRK